MPGMMSKIVLDESLEVTNDRVLAPGELSPEESAVLGTFAEYLMPPKQMLCLNIDKPSTKHALDRLVKRGLLETSGFKTGYSLTNEGFHAMKTSHRGRASKPKSPAKKKSSGKLPK